MADISSSLPTQDKADGADGATAPSVAVAVGGKDPSGNLQTILTDASGAIYITGRIVLTPASPTTFSTGVASATAVAFNANRKGLVLTNTSNARISIAFGVAAVLNSGITLYPGGIFVMDDQLFTTASVSAIASVAASGLAIQEYS